MNQPQVPPLAAAEARGLLREGPQGALSRASCVALFRRFRLLVSQGGFEDAVGV